MIQPVFYTDPRIHNFSHRDNGGAQGEGVASPPQQLATKDARGSTWAASTTTAVAAESAHQRAGEGTILLTHLESRAAYDRLLRNEPTRKILQGLEIHDLYDAARLTRLFVVVASSANLGQVRSAPEIYDLYETLRSLARVEATCRALLKGNDRRDRTNPGTSEASDRRLRRPRNRAA